MNYMSKVPHIPTQAPDYTYSHTIDYDNDQNQIFIAYEGTELKHNIILEILQNFCPANYKVEFQKHNTVLFAKVVHQLGYGVFCNECDSMWRKEKILTVSNYEIDKLSNFVWRVRDIYDFWKTDFAVPGNYVQFCNYHENGANFHSVVSKMIYRKNSNILEIVQELRNTPISSVIWDSMHNTMMAFITTSKSHLVGNLYYGYTTKNHEIIYSSKKEILQQFCDESEIYELEACNYMINNEIYNFSGEIIGRGQHFDEVSKLIEERKLRFDINSLNEEIATKIIKILSPHIMQNALTYLEKDSSRYLIKKILLENPSVSSKKEILSLIEKTLKEYLDGNIDNHDIDEMLKEIITPYNHNKGKNELKKVKNPSN